MPIARSLSFPFLQTELRLSDLKPLLIEAPGVKTPIYPEESGLKMRSLETDKFDSGVRSHHIQTSNPLSFPDSLSLPSPPEYEFPKQDESKFSLTPALKRIQNSFNSRSSGSHTSAELPVSDASPLRQLTVDNLPLLNSRLESIRQPVRRHSCSDIRILRDTQNSEPPELPVRAKTFQTHSTSSKESVTQEQSPSSLVIHTSDSNLSDPINLSPTVIEVGSTDKEVQGAQALNNKAFSTEKSLSSEMLSVKAEKQVKSR